MTVEDVVPSIQEINAVLRRHLGWEPLTATQAAQPVPVTPEQLLRLVRALGWHPTPSQGECLDGDGAFCCPRCGHSRIEHVAEGPCDFRDVNGFNDDGELVITYTMRACGSEGDWWLQCRHCLFEFELPDGWDVEWN